MVEVMPYGQTTGEAELASSVARGARAFAEFGADFIKAQYSGSPGTFRQVLEATYVPVVILGGPRASSDLDLLTMTHDALSVGAAGVAFGRNVWQHSTPTKLVRALRAVIHERARPEQAVKLLK